MIEQPSLTPKAERTRQHILNTALALFVDKGYEATTMRDIAAAAGCSLGLTYRYFARKEDLVLALYARMASETAAQVQQLEAASQADRFHQVMVKRLEQAAPYREAIGALFGAAMNPGSGANLLGDGTAAIRDQTLAAFYLVVIEASDAPRQEQAEELAALLYSLHFGVILFWLYDRSDGQRVTHELLGFIRDMLRVTRRFLFLPFMAQGLARLARIMESVFVGR